MPGGSHTVVIELYATDGPPEGRISVDGTREHAFCGWIDLTARLDSLRRDRRSSRPTEAHARVEPGKD
jgi:hypothetical protein